jgi:hypothetical protein
MDARTVERAVPILPGDELGAAKAFYGRLGFSVRVAAPPQRRRVLRRVARPRGDSAAPAEPGVGGTHVRVIDPAGNELFVIGPIPLASEPRNAKRE